MAVPRSGAFGTPTSIETMVKNLVSGRQDTFKAEVADFATRYADQVRGGRHSGCAGRQQSPLPAGARVAGCCVLGPQG